MSRLLVGTARFITIVRLILIRFLQRNVISIKRSRFFAPLTQPDQIIRVLPQRSSLCASRVFVPHRDGDVSRSLPLVIMVHGGGFMMNRPCVDDPIARYVADNCSCLVASIDHRKAPTHQFPAAYEDVVESILALLRGCGPMNVDVSRVVLCGNSSGGNLVLAAAQDPRLRGMLLGVIALSPVVNLLPTEAEQMAKRPDATVPDFLAGMWDTFRDVYVGTDDAEVLRDPRLSPTFFRKREDLPEHIFMVGCEHDMLCCETEIMANKMANKPREKTQDGWRAGEIQWKLVKGQPHGFDNFAKKKLEEEEARVRAKAMLYDDITHWLREVFKTT